MHRGVLFDLDGVLIRFCQQAWRELADWLRPCTPGELNEAILLARIRPVWEKYYLKIIDFEVNRGNEAAFWRGMAAEVLRSLKSSCPLDKALAEWPYYRFLEPLPRSKVLLEWLKLKGYTVGVYANIVPSLRQCLDYHGLGAFIDHAFSSSELGYVKPDGRGYLRVAELMGLQPEQIVYFDDNEFNVDYARRTGYRAYLVRLGQPGPEVIHDMDLIYEILE
ncbi:HAD family hydrolase [Oceanithermus sp.]